MATIISQKPHLLMLHREGVGGASCGTSSSLPSIYYDSTSKPGHFPLLCSSGSGPTQTTRVCLSLDVDSSHSEPIKIPCPPCSELSSGSPVDYDQMPHMPTEPMESDLCQSLPPYPTLLLLLALAFPSSLSASCSL